MAKDIKEIETLLNELNDMRGVFQTYELWSWRNNMLSKFVELFEEIARLEQHIKKLSRDNDFLVASIDIFVQALRLADEQDNNARIKPFS